MKRLLLVDDDAFVVKAYRDRLSAHGFQVNTAADGMAAINVLRSARPDVVVLDLMMPGLSGVEVLKFMRGEKRLADIPVIILTNAYLNDLGKQAASLGIQGAFLKNQCSPSVLMGAIDEIFQTSKPPADEARPSDAPVASAPPPPVATPAPAAPAAPAPVHNQTKTNPTPTARASGATPSGASARTSEAEGTARAYLVSHGPAICAELRRLFQAFAHPPSAGTDHKVRLQGFYQKVHFLAAAAGLAGYGRVVQVVTVFEALLYEVMDKPARMGPSVLQTVARLLDCTEGLLQQPRDLHANSTRPARVLIVDDDPLATRVAAAAARQAQLEPTTTENPLVGWQKLQQEQFDAVLLDVEMPELSGFDLCKRLRALPGYKQTPVIYVTVHTDFETRAKGTLAGGDDLISKPILPIELAAKLVMHLVKERAPAHGAGPNVVAG